MGNASSGLEAAFIALPVLMLALLLAGLWRIRSGPPGGVGAGVAGSGAGVAGSDGGSVGSGVGSVGSGGSGAGRASHGAAWDPVNGVGEGASGGSPGTRLSASEAKSRDTGRSSVLLAAALALLWLAVTALAAGAGLLTFATTPPTLLIAVVIGVLLAVRLGTSRLGLRLAGTIPLALLVGTQAFRLPLELAMHRAWAEGLMPQQMSYSGFNFDIVTGATALLLGVALAYWRVPTVVVHAWNAIGFVLLLNVVAIAVLSTPIPIRVFMNEPANTWITAFPWVWLPTVLVPAAFLGHILVWRRLRMERGIEPAAAPARA